jgi:hypothetical protein
MAIEVVENLSVLSFQYPNNRIPIARSNLAAKFFFQDLHQIAGSTVCREDKNTAYLTP